MPLRDHFHPPLTNTRSWDALHGQWPAMIVLDLNRRLPRQYIASPHVHLGNSFEVDVATLETEGDSSEDTITTGSEGGAVTAVWAPPKPTFTAETDLGFPDEYQVQVMEAATQRLVATVEIVSPANKDRPEHRRAFVAKCAALLRQSVAVSIVDLVSTRRANLGSELLEMFGETDPSFTPSPPSMYAATYRQRLSGQAWNLDSWAHKLEIGQSLPTLPLWLGSETAIPLDLEATYEETCRGLRIG